MVPATNNSHFTLLFQLLGRPTTHFQGPHSPHQIWNESNHAHHHTASNTGLKFPFVTKLPRQDIESKASKDLADKRTIAPTKYCTSISTKRLFRYGAIVAISLHQRKNCVGATLNDQGKIHYT